MTPPPSFGLLVRTRRKALGLTQDDLARQVGCSIVTIRKIEADERRPSAQMAARLARYLEVPPDDEAAFVRAARVDATALAGAPDSAPPRPQQPADSPPLLGRDELLARLRNRLLRAETRLLTLTGPGGVGKTSLALRLVAEVRPHFPDGATVVLLAAVERAELLLPSVAAALGLPDASGQSEEERLAGFLADRATLLLLDNLEQLRGTGAVLTPLLERCPSLKLLVTSRSALGCPGEQTAVVPPLALPPADAEADPEALLRFPATELFVRRTREILPRFLVTAANAQAISGICARLDGLPLAIELVAARANVLDPPALLERLAGVRGYAPLQLPQGAAHLPPRQRTLRGAIAWSYDLLAPAERRLFSQLGVFVGGFTLDAAEAVCAADDLEPIDVLDGLQSLLEAHLITREGTADGGFRFGMLQTIREFARERLAAEGRAGAVQERHATYFLGLAAEADGQYFGPDEPRWLARLSEEHDNLRAALQHTLERPDPATAAALGHYLWWFWYLRGHWREGRAWLERIIALVGAGAGLPPATHGDLYKGAATLAKELGLYGSAEARYHEATAIYRASGDERGLASTLNNLGGLYHRQGKLDAARRCYTDSLAHFRIAEMEGAIALVLDNLSILLQEHGHYAEAQVYHEESLVLWRTVGDMRGLANKLSSIGEFHLFQRDFGRTRDYYSEALALQQVNGDRRGSLASLQGLGLAHYWLSDLAAAREALRQAIEIADELGEQFFIALCLEGCAHVLGAQGRLEAAQLYGAAEGLREQLQTPITPAYRPLHDEAVARSSAPHDPRLWSAAWARGRSLPIEQAIALTTL